MVTTIVVPEGFRYVPASLMTTVFLAAWQHVQVGNARKAAGVAYPQLYAEKAVQDASKAALVFNCTQRAHQNTLENLPLAILMTLLTSLTMPVVAAAHISAWSFFRVLYHVGYATGDPDKRNTRGGHFSPLVLMSLIGTASYSAYQIFQAAA